MDGKRTVLELGRCRFAGWVSVRMSEVSIDDRQSTWLAAKKRKVNSLSVKTSHLLTSSHVRSQENQQQLDHDLNG